MAISYVEREIRWDELQPGDNIIELRGQRLTFVRHEHIEFYGMPRKMPVFREMPTNAKVVVGRYEDVPFGPYDPNYMATKYDCEWTDRLHQIADLDQALAWGDGDWACKIKIDEGLEAELRTQEFLDLKPWGAYADGAPSWVILAGDDRGFVWSSWYYSKEELDKDWALAEKCHDEWWEQEDAEDGWNV